MYLALILFLFGYLPFKIYQLYDHAQVLTKVNEAIVQGDPDIRRVLDLIDDDPTEGWQADPVTEVAQPTDPDYTGIELMTHSRIIDLRHWDPSQPDKAHRGKVYVSDRVELRLTES